MGHVKLYFDAKLQGGTVSRQFSHFFSDRVQLNFRAVLAGRQCPRLGVTLLLEAPMLGVGIIGQKSFTLDHLWIMVQVLETGGRVAPTSNYSSKIFTRRVQCLTLMSLLR